jgi:hypothetical protein
MLVLFSTCTWLHAGAKGPKARSNMGIRKVDRRETLEVETLEIHDDDLLVNSNFSLSGEEGRGCSKHATHHTQNP